jgi:hypothetical protein
MYQNHVPTIAAAMRHCPKTFAAGIMFAVVSARTQFITVPSQMLDLELNGSRARCLWSWKRDAFAYVQEHAAEMHREIIATTCPEKALRVLLRVPGLGFVKGGFVLQLMGFDVACLDTRNVAREGRDPEAFATKGKKSGPRFERLIAQYLSEVCGRSEYYWDVWCEDVAGTYKRTAEQISEMHLCFVSPKLRRKLAPVAVPLNHAVPF